MQIPGSLALFISLVVSSPLPQPQAIFSHRDAPGGGGIAGYRIPTVHESAVMGRKVLRFENIGTLSTIFPSNKDSALPFENRPAGLGGAPIGLMDYFADCEPGTGNPTILAITIATSFKNVAAGSNITLSMRWHPPFSHARRWSAAALPRFSLVGHLEDIPREVAEKEFIPACFIKYHPDAVTWLPGNMIHESHFVRLVVDEIYWIGGFGDRAYIGWIPVSEWTNVTEKEIHSIKLPGERKGWSVLEWLEL